MRLNRSWVRDGQNLFEVYSSGSGRLYLADNSNNMIRVWDLDTSTEIVSEAVNTGSLR